MRKSQRKKRTGKKGRFFITVLLVSAAVFMCVWSGLTGWPDACIISEIVKGGGRRGNESPETAGQAAMPAWLFDGGRMAFDFDNGSEGAYQSSLKIENTTGVEAGTVLSSGKIDIGAPEKYFTIQEIDDNIFKNVNGKSYHENGDISLNELRYLKLLHYNYEHEIQVGELIVNEKIAEDCRNIFRELFEQEYEIQSMRLVDNYWTGDSGETDKNSIEHNNTSAFHYRVITGGAALSEHALGYAVDVNPLQNPYVNLDRDGNPTQYYKDMELYLDRTSGAGHMITSEDICYQTFIKYGFSWGGDWENPKDYQHFEKKIE